MAKTEIQSLTRTFSKDNNKNSGFLIKRKIEKKLRAENEFKIQNLIDETTPPPWLNNDFENYSLALTGIFE